jgi:hypothetical protein
VSPWVEFPLLDEAVELGRTDIVTIDKIRLAVGIGENSLMPFWPGLCARLWTARADCDELNLLAKPGLIRLFNLPESWIEPTLETTF